MPTLKNSDSTSAKCEHAAVLTGSLQMARAFAAAPGINLKSITLIVPRKLVTTSGLGPKLAALLS